MNTCFIILSIGATLLISCTGDRRAGEIAGEICACFEPVNATVSAETRRLLRDMGESADPDSTYRMRMRALDDSGRIRVARELGALSGLHHPSHPVGRCLQELGDKYWQDNKEQVDQQEIRRQMLKRSGCELAAFIAAGTTATGK